MASKTTSEMMDMFNLISTEGLSPNEFYLLYNMQSRIEPMHINIHQDIRTLLNKEFIKDISKSDISAFELTPKANELINKVESFFKVQKKKTNEQIMGNRYQDNVLAYIEIFPKMMLPSKKPARSDKKNVETALKWFIETYEYSWDTIFKATTSYVTDFETRGYKYMQTSQYFIRKQNADRTWASELANMCAVVEGGELDNDVNHFKEKVV